jgi:uncharacterized circularly permuted ATP-grasp superfamily protein
MVTHKAEFAETAAPCSSRQPVRKINTHTWSVVEAAIQERVEAVELFLADVAGRFRFRSEMGESSELIAQIQKAREYVNDAQPVFQRRVWLASMDLVRDSAGQFWFVDDHYCCPFGLFRLKHLVDAAGSIEASIAFEEFSSAARVSLEKYTGPNATAVVLGSNTFNTSYRENRYFSEFLGIPYVTNGHIRAQRHGLFHNEAGREKRVGLVIRRLLDDDLDPACFRPDSLQGVQGLVQTAGRGLATVMNAPGTGLFNSRLLTRWIPRMVKFYLGREPRCPTVTTLEANDRAIREITMSRLHHHKYIFRTNNSLDLLKPMTGVNQGVDEVTQYFQRSATHPRPFVARSVLGDISGGSEAVYSLRTFYLGTENHTVFSGGIARSCADDGTPLAPVTQDRTAHLATAEKH